MMHSARLLGSSLFRCLAGLALFIFSLSGMALGQGLTAVTGRVTDPTGAIIPGVEITITNTATGNTRTVLTNELGIYTATQLAPGTYNIKAELSGFKPKAANNVALPVDQTITLNLPLEVGAVTDIVDVTASAEVVNTENAQLGVGFDSKKILELPLNARNIVGLLSLQTGVSVDTDDSRTSGYVNGARNDQQNIVLDGVDINRQQAGSAFQGALPTTLDSVQEFIVQTTGQGAASARSSGAQVQLVTKSGSNQFHGSAYEAYRSKVTTATPYFSKDYACTEAAPCKPGLIRQIPGGSFGGPIIQNKLFFFGAYERRTDRSQTSVSRTIPTETFLNGIVRYQRTASAVAKDGQAYGIISQGCGGAMEQITLVPCDTVNPAVIGPNGYLEQYRKYLTSTQGTLTCGSDCSNFQTFRFNAPNISNQNIYVARFDYTINAKNTVYVRGTLNNQADLQSPTFPDINNALTNYDNSKGFAASLNSVISPTINNNFTAGLTREGTSNTGAASVSFGFGPSSLFQTRGAQWRHINTWNFVDNLSIVKGAHTWQMGVNLSFVNNNLRSFDVASPGSFGNATNEYAGDTTGDLLVPRGLGDTEAAAVSNKQTLLTAITEATGTFNKLTGVGIQFDTQGNLLPVGTPFERSMRLDQYDLYIQDSWKVRSNLSLNYGLHWGLITPPWEKDGNQVNWVQSLKDRYNTLKGTTKTFDELTPLQTQLAGRANGLPDYYAPALDNFAPRASFAYTPKWDNGFLGALANKGGQMVIRGGYSLSFDHTGGSLGTDAAASGAIGLLTSFASPIQSFSQDGAGQPRAPRVTGTGSNLVLPFNAFPISSAQSFVPASSDGGWGGPRGLPSIDNTLRPPANHLVNFTISKELPGGIVIEGSYVGRFARNLLDILDLANPLNVIDAQSGIDYYGAQKMLFEKYENQGVGSQVGKLSATNVIQAVANVQPIPWFENVYAGYADWASDAGNKSFGYPGVNFASNTQAFYAVLNKNRVPGPNAAVVWTDATNNFETAVKKHITTNPQAQYQGFYTNVGWSNYNSGQFTIRKRFSEGYTLTGNYTLSHSLDITSAGEALGNRPGGSGSADQLIDPYHPELNYGNSTFDRRHQFNGNFVAELPFGSGKWVGGNASGLLDQIIGGWAVSGIVQMTSGSPYLYRAGNRYTLHFNGSDIGVPAGVIDYQINKGHSGAVTDKSGNITGGGTPTVFYIKDQDLAAGCASDATCPDSQVNRRAAVNKFVTPYYGGALARNYVYGPGFFNMDASISKNLKITEGVTGQLRAEAFNVLNHPNFSNPSSNNIDSTSGTLGQITSTRNAARVMQFTVRLQF
jgi:Carboxypeptidase regulatory-like domain